MTASDVSPLSRVGEPDPALAAWHDRLTTAVAEELPAAVELRHRLHADPRLSGDEQDTADAVVAALGLGEGRRVADTGRVVRVVDGPGPAVALRAELDGLAVDEATGVPWTSTGGVMHACGHDAHLAGMVAVARAVARVGGPAPLVLLLQPREEQSPSGAADAVASGVLTEERVDSVVAAHVQPSSPAGVVNATPGPVNAATDEFTITVTGHGGHGGYPHTTLDRCWRWRHRREPAAAGQPPGRPDRGRGARGHPVGRREVLQRHPRHRPGDRRAAGDARGGPRAAAAGAHRRRRAHAVAHGCTARVEVHENEPVLANDPELARAAVPWLTRSGVPVDDSWRSFGADDFSHFCAGHRGLMLFLGVDAGAPTDDGRRRAALATVPARRRGGGRGRRRPGGRLPGGRRADRPGDGAGRERRGGRREGGRPPRSVSRARAT